MTPRQEAIALITAAEDPDAMRTLWLGKENSAFVLCSELAVQASAAIRFVAAQAGMESTTLMHRLGIEAAIEEAKRHA
jgi:hypothetical protein